jgi:LacI family transcriptional regulator
MARRPNIPDLAQAAGVSVATVDRVLNARGMVREETKARVYAAAQAIGYHGAALIGARLAEDAPVLRLGVVLHKDGTRSTRPSARNWRRPPLPSPGGAPVSASPLPPASRRATLPD